MGGIQGWHIVILIVLAIVLFGAPKLPGMARSVGQSLRIFKSEVKQMKDENNTPDVGAGPVEGRVVNNPVPQTYAPTHPSPMQPTGQPDQQYGQPVQPPVADGQGYGQGYGQAGHPNRTGPSHQDGTPHGSQ